MKALGPLLVRWIFLRYMTCCCTVVALVGLCLWNHKMNDGTFTDLLLLLGMHVILPLCFAPLGHACFNAMHHCALFLLCIHAFNNSKPSFDKFRVLIATT